MKDYRMILSKNHIANCAYYLFLGSRDLQCCQDIAKRMNVPLDRVLYKSREDVFILSNFSRPIVDAIYNVRTHPCYDRLESESNILSRSMDMPNKPTLNHQHFMTC